MKPIAYRNILGAEGGSMTGVLAAPSPDLLAIPCVLMRGGTSKAVFFLASDPPADPKVRDLAILAAMDGVDRRQVDGLGGANPLTTKVAIISLSQQPGIDVDYLFGQVVIGESRIDYVPTCGNILAAVGPFALETGPLTGIRVLDLTRALAGPYCTMMLGDMGAEVIKVESPDGGDDSRAWAPPFIGKESAYYLSCNKNKKSMTLNLRSDAAKKILTDLIKVSDVVVENFRPGVMKKMGFPYETLKAINPKVIFCSITGFGTKGPDAQKPGFDLIAQGMSGFMSFTGEVGGGPIKVGVALADINSGMFAAYGILTALYHRAGAGLGRTETRAWN